MPLLGTTHLILSPTCKSGICHLTKTHCNFRARVLGFVMGHGAGWESNPVMPPTSTGT
jgi:hypothetical protein